MKVHLRRKHALLKVGHVVMSPNGSSTSLSPRFPSDVHQPYSEAELSLHCAWGGGLPNRSTVRIVLRTIAMQFLYSSTLGGRPLQPLYRSRKVPTWILTLYAILCIDLDTAASVC